jgi:hypothetical protein
VTVKDAADTTLTSARCVKYIPTCVVSARYIPTYQIYRAAYVTHFGVAEVTPRGKPPQPRGAAVG